MTPSALFIITSDPRHSARPAEAIRIAAGVAAWRKVEVSVYLHQTATLCLRERTEDLVDAEHFAQYLPILQEMSCPLFVEENATPTKQSDEMVTRAAPISTSRLAELAARSNYVLHF